MDSDWSTINLVVRARSREELPCEATASLTCEHPAKQEHIEDDYHWAFNTKGDARVVKYTGDKDLFFLYAGKAGCCLGLSTREASNTSIYSSPHRTRAEWTGRW